MNKTIGLLAISALLLSSNVAADSHMQPASHEQTCREMAVEDNVTPDKMDRYMAWCLEELAIPETPEMEEADLDEERPGDDADRMGNNDER